MIDRLSTFRVYRTTTPLSSMQISDLYFLLARFYESLNEKSWMYEYPNPVT